jgi:hypothetical protein
VSDEQTESTVVSLARERAHYWYTICVGPTIGTYRQIVSVTFPIYDAIAAPQEWRMVSTHRLNTIARCHR